MINSIAHEHVKKNPRQNSPVNLQQCDFNVSIWVLQEYVKTQHPGNLTTSDFYYNKFLQLGKPSVYHTHRHPRHQFDNFLT